MRDGCFIWQRKLLRTINSGGQLAGIVVVRHVKFAVDRRDSLLAWSLVEPEA